MQPPISAPGSVLALVVRARDTQPVGVELETPDGDGSWRRTFALLVGPNPTKADFVELGRALWIGLTS